MADVDSWLPDPGQLETDIRNRLAVVCAHLSAEELDALVRDIAATKVRFLRAEAESSARVRTGRPRSGASLAQRMGSIPIAMRTPAAPPRAQTDR